MMKQLNEFEQNLLLFAKNHYRYDGHRVDGAMVIVGHIAGITPSHTNLRQVAQWLVTVLVSLDRTSPHALAGGLPRVLSELLDGIARNYLMPPETERQALNYWRSVVENLLSQIAITQIKKGNDVYIAMPEPDPQIQSVLDLVATPATLFRCWKQHSLNQQTLMNDCHA